MALIKCKECGALVSDMAKSCPKCGAPIANNPSAEQQPSYPPTQPSYPPKQPSYPPTQPSYPPTQPAYQPVDPQDTPNTGLNVLSFFFPIVGWVLYYVFKDQTPIKAKACSKYAWIGFGISMFFYIIGDFI